MSTASFALRLAEQLRSSNQALIAALERKDRLLYVDAVNLRREYMDKIGNSEQGILESELAVFILERKRELIQRCINRGEEVDMKSIDNTLQKERDEKVKGLEEASKSLEEIPKLTDEELEELNKLYHRIVSEFHPSVHPEVTAMQKEMYLLALEAYKRQNLDEMRLAADSLFNDDAVVRILEMLFKAMGEDGTDSELIKTTVAPTDYSLADRLAGSFIKTKETEILEERINQNEEKLKDIYRECDEILGQFPFTAKATLEDPQKIEQYKESLEVRKKTARDRIYELEEKIEKLLEEAQRGE